MRSTYYDEPMVISTRLDEQGNPSVRLGGGPIRSSSTYPRGYKLKGIVEQIAILRRHFPELEDATYDENIVTRSLPPNAEGWFAIPRWEIFSSSYSKSFDRVLSAIAVEREFLNLEEETRDEATSEYLCQHIETMKAFRKLSKKQKGYDILIVPCQFGLRYAGYSAYQSRMAATADEFVLGAYAVGCMLLTHPERIVHEIGLSLKCAGDYLNKCITNEYGLAFVFFLVGSDLMTYLLKQPIPVAVVLQVFTS